MDRLERVKKEIERRLREDNLYVYSRTEYEDLLKFINSLYEEPKHSSLERLKIEEPILEILDRYLDRVSDEEAIKTKTAINEWFSEYFPKLQEEPVSKDLEEAASFYANTHTEWFDHEGNPHVAPAFKAGAEWQKEQFENNRLKHCNSITNEQAELEQGFIDQHLDEHQRMPTFLDAIEYGMQLQKEQIMENAIKCEITWMDGFMLNYTQEQQDDLLEKIGVKVGDKVKLVIIKED